MQTRARTSLFDALAEALAATLARRPLLAAAVFAASIPLVRDIVWGAAAAFVGAALVTTTLPRESGAGRTSGAVFWIACIGLTAIVVLLETSGVAHEGRLADWATVLFAAAALGAAPRSAGARIVAFAVLAASWAASLHTRDAVPVHRLLAGPALTTLTVGLLAFAPRRARWLLAIGVTAASLWFTEMTSPYPLRHIRAAISSPGLDATLRGFAPVALASFAAGTALLAGIAGHSLSRGPLPDAATRCIVAIRRAPWRSSLGIALVVLIGVTPSIEFRADTIRMFVAVAVPAAVLLGALARAAPSSIDVLAPIAAASTLTLLSSIWLNTLHDRGLFAQDGIVVASTAVLWTFAVSWLLDDGRLLRAARMWIWWALVVVACALSLPDAAPALSLAALALAPFVVQGLVASTAPAVSLVKAAAVFGLACSAACAFQRIGPAPRRMWGPLFLDDIPGQRIWTSAWWPLALSLAVALAAIAARRLRSMTVVPRDHPIVEDFGGEERSLRAGDVTSGGSGGPIA